jgi:1-acyl-sn-glycerol-3-phosphate acyltransferase
MVAASPRAAGLVPLPKPALPTEPALPAEPALLAEPARLEQATQPVSELWQPRSSCGARCLPSPDQLVAASRLTQARRLAGLIGTLLLGALLLPVLPVLSERRRGVAGRRWARAVLAALGVRLVARGRLPHRRALLAANHISWLDIVAILAVAPARLLAKQEVRRWPLIGLLAAAAGAIFIDRSRPRRLPATVADIAAALRTGGVVAVFPEGTTWCGIGAAGCESAGRFRSAMFQAAIDVGAVVVPLTLGYTAGRSGDGTTVAAFVGDDTLWDSLRRVLATRELTVTVTAAATVYLEPSANRRALARIAESAVRMVPPTTGNRSGHAGKPGVPDLRQTRKPAPAAEVLGLAA